MDRERLTSQVSVAIRHFWGVRAAQQESQGRTTGAKDYGSHGAVTGGAQLNGFVRLVAALVADAGLPQAAVFWDGRRETCLPGFFRATKSWDLLVVHQKRLLASIEFKSQVGSFGNNFNNRTEEAVGSATDFWTAYRQGAFKPSPRPWLGYFMLLEEAPRSTSPVGNVETHFTVFPEFQNASYARRYELLCLKLVRERLYDAACLLLSDRARGRRGHYREPNEELSFVRLAASLTAHISAHVQVHGDGSLPDR